MHDICICHLSAYAVCSQINLEERKDLCDNTKMVISGNFALLSLGYL